MWTDEGGQTDGVGTDRMRTPGAAPQRSRCQRASAESQERLTNGEVTFRLESSQAPPPPRTPPCSQPFWHLSRGLCLQHCSGSRAHPGDDEGGSKRGPPGLAMPQAGRGQVQGTGTAQPRGGSEHRERSSSSPVHRAWHHEAPPLPTRTGQTQASPDWETLRRGAISKGFWEQQEWPGLAGAGGHWPESGETHSTAPASDLWAGQGGTSFPSPPGPTRSPVHCSTS